MHRALPAILLLFAAFHSTAAPLLAAEFGEPVLLGVRINGAEVDEAAWLLRLPDGSLAASADNLRAWRLIVPAERGVAVGERLYFQLGAIDGLDYRVDPASQTLLLSVPPDAFEPTRIALSAARASRTSSGPAGGFLNYDLLAQQTDGRSSGGGLFEIGAFNRWGSGNLTALWNSTRPQPLLRLDTRWNIDFPERMQSLRLGDSISGGGSWGRAFRFGGLQWASNFSTQPAFVPFALPTIRGAAVLPSSVDVYIDNAQRLHSDVPAGPFDLANVPVITGQGEMQLAIRDQLGRQQIIRQSYYVSQALLKPGLRDFSYEIGRIREDYGIASGHYGRPVLIANDRMGVTPEFTRELRLEWLGGQQTVGAGGAWLIPRVGTGSLNAALSRGPDGYGWQLGLGVERQARDLSFGLRASYAARDFAQIANLAGATPRLTLQANLGLPVGASSLGLAYLYRTTWEGEQTRLLSASYSLRVGRNSQLGLLALRTFGAESLTTLGLVLTMAFDERTSASADFTAAGGGTQGNLQLQRSLPAGEGIGYRLLAGQGEVDRLSAGLAWQTPHATLSAEAGNTGGIPAYRAGLSGGVAVAGGGVFFSRRIDDSFAVVKVGDYAGVRVTRDNQEVGRTDADGLILVTRLRAYQDNPIGIEQADLPIDAEIDTLLLKLAPALRSGVVAVFPVRRGHSASFRLVDEAGRVLPPGTRLYIAGQAREFSLGYDGLGFVTGLVARNRLQVDGAAACVAEIALPEAGEALADLGTVICRRIRP